MIYKSKKQLQRLSNKQIFEDVKKYIKTSHTFYETRIPELKVLAKRLHEEYSLSEFYKVFNKLWNSGHNEERSLAIHTLQLYKEDFNIETWKFIKTKLKEIKSWDKVDIVSLNIIGEILCKTKKMEQELIIMAKSKNIWFKRMAVISTIPVVKKEEIDFPLTILQMCLYSKEEQIQTAVGMVLKEINEVKPVVAKKFILKNIQMPIITFSIATENNRELRKLRDVKKIGKNKVLSLRRIKNIFGR
ncbi:DNA alkylation repair enzyme [uncultured archaeon]|nr:DNA alkylation repair enzyme [uncultured archaeon]